MAEIALCVTRVGAQRRVRSAQDLAAVILARWEGVLYGMRMLGVAVGRGAATSCTYSDTGFSRHRVARVATKAAEHLGVTKKPTSWRVHLG
jgi:hypothetical protein